MATSAITRSSVLDVAGARTQLSGALSAIIVAPLLVVGTAAFSDIPITVLAAIVVAAVLPFIKIAEARRLWRVQRADVWVMALAFVGTLVLGSSPLTLTRSRTSPSVRGDQKRTVKHRSSRGPSA